MSGMTVSDLIALLKELPQEALVVLSRDSEGNDFSPLSESYSKGVYIQDSAWAGDFQSPPPPESLDPHDMYGEEREEWESGTYDDQPPAICLWPVA
jgi:hypothetical protein